MTAAPGLQGDPAHVDGQCPFAGSTRPFSSSTVNRRPPEPTWSAPSTPSLLDEAHEVALGASRNRPATHGRARRVSVDGARHEGQEPGAAALEPLQDSGPRLVELPRVPQEAGESSEKPPAEPQILDREGGALAASPGRSRRAGCRDAQRGAQRSKLSISWRSRKRDSGHGASTSPADTAMDQKSGMIPAGRRPRSSNPPTLSSQACADFREVVLEPARQNLDPVGALASSEPEPPDVSSQEGSYRQGVRRQELLSREHDVGGPFGSDLRRLCSEAHESRRDGLELGRALEDRGVALVPSGEPASGPRGCRSPPG